MAAAELYRLALVAEVPDDAWKNRLHWTTCYKGVSGHDDSFVHLLTAEQVVGKANIDFAGKSDVILLRFSTESMCDEAGLDIRWENAAPEDVTVRAGKVPHAYGGAIPYACLSAPPALLALGPDGLHDFPPLGTAAAAIATTYALMDDNDGVDECIDRGMDDEDGYDGCAATGMYG